MSNPELPIIITSFRDFELEERVIRILSQMGFPIGDRKIVGDRRMEPREILITDQHLVSNEIPIIALPAQAQRFNDVMLHHFLSRYFIPHSRSTPSGLVITGGESLTELRGELLTYLAPFGARLAHYEEGDRNLALIPTRRKSELERMARFSDSQIALFLLAADRKESQRAESFIEYRRRIHPHLEMAFVIHGGRKQMKSEIRAMLEPFMIFWIEDERDDLFRLRLRKPARGRERFLEIAEWIGSRHGDAHQSRTLLDHAAVSTRRARDRAPFRAGGAMANSR